MARMVLRSAAAAVCLLSAAPALAGSLGGNAPYNFPARNSSFAAQMEMSERLGGGASANGLAALQYFFSSSTSVGNMTTVTVGDGSSPSMNLNTTQSSNGSQAASGQAPHNATATGN